MTQKLWRAVNGMKQADLWKSYSSHATVNFHDIHLAWQQANLFLFFFLASSVLFFFFVNEVRAWVAKSRGRTM